MMSDRTNYSEACSAPSSSGLVASTNREGKRPFVAENGDFLPSKLKAKRRLGRLREKGPQRGAERES